MTVLRLVVGTGTELSLPTPDDAGELQAVVAANRDYLLEWLPWAGGHRNVADSADFIRRNHDDYLAGRGFAMVLRHRGVLVGCVGLLDLDPARRRGRLGYWLGEGGQGQGLATRSAATLVDYAFRDRRLHRLEIHVAADNRRSRAVARRLGFVQEGVLREAEWLHYRFVDRVVYGQLDREWRCDASRIQDRE